MSIEDGSFSRKMTSPEHEFEDERFKKKEGKKEKIFNFSLHKSLIEESKDGKSLLYLYAIHETRNKDV